MGNYTVCRSRQVCCGMATLINDLVKKFDRSRDEHAKEERSHVFDLPLRFKGTKSLHLSCLYVI